jgi:hypothetical protein
MFEQELQMETKESSVLPLLLIVAFIIAVVGFAGYYMVQSQRVPSVEEATNIAAGVLEEPGAGNPIGSYGTGEILGERQRL